MTWRDEYQPGSFRGASFRTQGHERSGGRRTAIHELPARDEPVVEDLGRRARQFRFDCHVIGADYRGQRDALIDALEQSGPGELVHPWFGRTMVSVLDYAVSEDTDEGGMARFSITLTEAGEPAPAPAALAGGASAGIAADLALADAPAAFAGQFSIDKASSWVEAAAGDIVKGMADASQIAAGLRGGVGPTLRAFDMALNFLPGNLSSLLRAPVNLAHSVIGLVSAVAVLGDSAGRKSRVESLQTLLTWLPETDTQPSSAYPSTEAATAAASSGSAALSAAAAIAANRPALTQLLPLRSMLDWAPSGPQFPERTPQRRLEAANRAALVGLFQIATAAELVRAAAAIDYASYDDARATRDAIGGQLDTLAIAAADRGDDAANDTFDSLRRALVADIAAKGESLARVYELDLATTEPALVVAHRLYRQDRRTDTSLEARAIGIAARNRIAHPGFLPGGVTLEMLTSEAAA